MNAPQGEAHSDREILRAARQRGPWATLAAFARLSGPGWLQGAITLGGGSLAGSLYLGVVGGFGFLWLQPLMMLFGVCMLSAIAYVTLSTGQRPFQAINQHINPVLGWGWAIATLMANLVWAMPQFSLGAAALTQNLAPQVFQGSRGDHLAVAVLFAVACLVVWCKDQGGKGALIFDCILKAMVAIVVLSFLGVVLAMAWTLPWKDVFSGFIPDFTLLFQPAAGLQPFLDQSPFSDYWRKTLLATQRDQMVTAAATAVGINMTFLLPYSMLGRGWNRDFRGLAVFDLFTGLMIPLVLATSCVVIASAAQFHGKYDPGLVGEAEPTEVTRALKNSYQSNLDGLLRHVHGVETVKLWTDEQRGLQHEQASLPDRRLAAMLVQRDAQVLAQSLEQLTGKTIAQYVFGVGVLGMAVSTIVILMLINGFVICEMVGAPANGALNRLASLLPGFSGGLGYLYLWSNKNANFWLAVPTSVFAMTLLPVAYCTFILMMNSRSLLKDDMPRGWKRAGVNAVLLTSLAGALVGAAWSIWGRAQPIPGTSIPVRWAAIGVVVAYVALVAWVHFRRAKPLG